MIASNIVVLHQHVESPGKPEEQNWLSLAVANELMNLDLHWRPLCHHLNPASSAKPLVCPFFRLILPLLTFLGPLPASVAASISSCVMLGMPGMPATKMFCHKNVLKHT